MQTKRCETDCWDLSLKNLKIGVRWSFLYISVTYAPQQLFVYNFHGLVCKIELLDFSANNAFLCVPVFNSVFPRLFGFVELAQFSGLRKGREIYGRTLIDSVF